MVREHLDALSDDIGIMQHAIGAQPDPRHGYCTDDVARALSVDLLHASELGWVAVALSVTRAVRFLDAACDRATGRFRNFRAADGAWLPGQGSEDAHARALRALGQLIATTPDDDMRASAVVLFDWALPAAATLRGTRPRAAALLGCDAVLRSGQAHARAAAVRRGLADALWATIGAPGPDASWPWPGTTATYENGLLPEALMAAGEGLGEPGMVERGRRLLDWLIEVQTTPDGQLSPIGNAGWWPQGGRRAQYDQQPIEVTALLLAAQAALTATGDARYEATMERCYAWFLGRNDGHVAVAIPERGACHDGLTPTGPNLNQGAESTLMWLIAVEGIRSARAAPATPIDNVGRGRA